ncbi:hypothetical protein ACWFMI_23405 [Nocardiopsis terrae]|uniref:hypothetical protein n=1 Tax=Streptomyces sp. NPDC057554 TaxID=3350538 RepID=UPI00367EF18A
MDADLAEWEHGDAARWIPGLNQEEQPPALIVLYMSHFALGRDEARAHLLDILERGEGSVYYQAFIDLITAHTQALGARILAPLGRAAEHLRELARRWEPYLEWLEAEEGQEAVAAHRAQQEQPLCLCQCSMTHGGQRGVCVEGATTHTRFSSPLTGPVDVPNCLACAAAVAQTRGAVTT